MNYAHFETVNGFKNAPEKSESADFGGGSSTGVQDL